MSWLGDLMGGAVNVSPIGDLVSAGSALIDRLVPDPQAAAAAKLKLLELRQSGELQKIADESGLMRAQAAIDKTEAASPNFFIAGGRPAIIWVCAAAFAWSYVLGPFVAFFLSATGDPVRLPVLDLSAMMPVLLGMLGLGGMRTVEKLSGRQGNH